MTGKPAPLPEGVVARILVVGASGAGKSTFAIRLGRELNLPVHHMDVAIWSDDQRRLHRTEIEQRFRRIAAQDAWVFEGPMVSRMPELRARADLVVFLDLPRWRCRTNWIIRRLRYLGRSRPGQPAHWREPLNGFGLRDMWDWHDKMRPQLLENLGKIWPRRRVLTLKSYAEAESLVQALVQRNR
ncbi:hypothetical protein [Thalassovita sp.]|uniref:hypothetical protein n=1 Tax=Thalassovita sp. TaxID=1979401 RepID=UPI0029DE79C8|nr:hypothetical protein [Thalassovita sp.]